MYTFQNLMSKAANGVSIGKWKGSEVFPISNSDFKTLKRNNEMKKDVWYVIYDDNNYMIKDNYVYGRLKENGNIESMRTFEYIKSLPKKPAAEPVKPVVEVEVAAEVKVPAAEINVGDIISEIDKLLQSACFWKDDGNG